MVFRTLVASPSQTAWDHGVVVEEEEEVEHRLGRKGGIVVNRSLGVLLGRERILVEVVV